MTTEKKAEKALTVTFERLRFPDQRHEAVFDLGSAQENNLCALRHAWNHNCRIVSHV